MLFDGPKLLAHEALCEAFLAVLAHKGEFLDCCRLLVPTLRPTVARIVDRRPFSLGRFAFDRACNDYLLLLGAGHMHHLLAGAATRVNHLFGVGAASPLLLLVFYDDQTKGAHLAVRQKLVGLVKQLRSLAASLQLDPRVYVLLFALSVLHIGAAHILFYAAVVEAFDDGFLGLERLLNGVVFADLGVTVENLEVHLVVEASR